jgi:tRNA dimethylallyltransferase
LRVPDPVLILAGPTATGKTALAVALASKYDAEVVSADSMQVYRGLDIGTAKPSAEEMGGVPHHLIDVVDPDEPFDAERFVALADQAIFGIQNRGKRVIVAGGTGLYLRALIHGLQKGPRPDPEIRARLTARAQEEGWPRLHEELITRDPETAGRLHPNDGVRILRALEVVMASRIPISEWHRQHQFAEVRYESCFLVLSRPRSELSQRIEARVDQMMAAGFLDEVRALMDRGYGPTLKPMQGLGYRRLAQCILGELTLEEAVEKTKTDTRRFAKRQVTWFKKEPGVRWTAPDLDAIDALTTKFCFMSK